MGYFQPKQQSATPSPMRFFQGKPKQQQSTTPSRMGWFQPKPKPPPPPPSATRSALLLAGNAASVGMGAASGLGKMGVTMFTGINNARRNKPQDPNFGANMFKGASQSFSGASKAFQKSAPSIMNNMNSFGTAAKIKAQNAYTASQQKVAPRTMGGKRRRPRNKTMRKRNTMRKRHTMRK